MIQIIVLTVISVSTVQDMFVTVAKDVQTVPIFVRVAAKYVPHVQKTCAATADNTAGTVWEKKTGVITVIHAGIVRV